MPLSMNWRKIMVQTRYLHRALIWGTLLCLSCANASAESKPLELKWNELASMIVGHVVQMALPDSTIIEGEAISAREDALLMDINRTSDSSVYPKGNARIPKASVQLIQLERRRGSWGRNLGTIIGVLSGVVLGAYVAGTRTHSAKAGIPTFLGIAGGVSVGGYVVGRGLDKRTTLIKIVP
jgi:hypothetical protein